jgi:hypothetical protein
MSAFDQILNDTNRVVIKNTQTPKPKTSKKKLIGIYLPIEIIAQIKKLSYETDKKVNDIYLEIIKKGLVD